MTDFRNLINESRKQRRQRNSVLFILMLLIVAANILILGRLYCPDTAGPQNAGASGALAAQHP